MNLNLNDLKQKLTAFSDKRVYAYVLSTISKDGEGCFIQEGSAPNFQGGLITLCTCKHQMRCGRPCKDWEGIWVAGFAGKGLQNALLYLMQVENAFGSQSEIWFHLGTVAKTEKAAHLDRFGDIFEPEGGPLRGDDRFCPGKYKKPCNCHSHTSSKFPDQWRKDIYYTRWGRNPAFLSGDPKMSFLWKRPEIFYDPSIEHPRTKSYPNPKEFLHYLK